jgi:putative ABC transport system permease protein
VGDFVSQVYHALLRRPMAFFMAVISLAIGVAAFICLGAVCEALFTHASATILLNNTSTPTIGVWLTPKSESRSVTPAKVEALARQVLGSEVPLIGLYKSVIKYGRHTLPDQSTCAIPAEVMARHSGHIQMAHGWFFSPADDREGRAVCILGQDFVDWYLEHEDPLGKAIRINGFPYVVIGISNQLNKLGVPGMAVLVPRATAQGQFRLQYTGLEAVLDAPPQKEKIEAEIARLQRVLAQQRAEGIGATVGSGWIRVLEYQELLAKTRRYLVLFGASLLLVGLLGLVGMLLANLTSRLQEIGIHLALGATRLRQAAEVVMQAILVGFLGGVLGVLLGLGIVHVYSGSHGLELVVTRFWMESALLVSVSAAFLAGLLPARAAMRISPIELTRA